MERIKGYETTFDFLIEKDNGHYGGYWIEGFINEINTTLSFLYDNEYKERMNNVWYELSTIEKELTELIDKYTIDQINDEVYKRGEE